MYPSESEHRGLPTVTVVVSFVNSARTIERCLRNILEQDYPRDLFTLVVVDGGSTDGSIAVCRRVESESENMRFEVMQGCTEPEGQIAGVESSNGEVIMFTNSDIYVPQNWIRRHVAWLLRGFDLVGGRVFWGGDKYAFTWNALAARRPQYEQHPGMGLGFSNCSVRRSRFLAAGGLSRLRSQHDTEFALRVVRRGGRLILDPEIEVYHDHPFRSLGGSFRRSAGYARNHVIVSRSTYGRAVPGSSGIVRLFLRSTLREWTMVNPVRIYRQLYPRARRHEIRVGVFEFIFIRLLSTQLGQLFGIFRGLLLPRASISSVKDLHGPEAIGSRTLGVPPGSFRATG